MGHAEAGSDMSAVYREGVDDSRLKAVSRIGGDHEHNNRTDPRDHDPY